MKTLLLLIFILTIPSICLSEDEVYKSNSELKFCQKQHSNDFTLQEYCYENQIKSKVKFINKAVKLVEGLEVM